MLKVWVNQKRLSMQMTLSLARSISPFDFVKSVTDTKENLIVDDWSEKQYNAFIVNKSLSHGQDTVVVQMK